MRSEIKRLFMGFIYSLMTFSFIMAPIPAINLAHAQSYDYTGGEGRKKVYKKGEDFDETREKTSLAKYSEEHGGIVPLIQQLTTGLMGITLLNAIKYKYTYENDPLLYGNDCGPNNAAKLTIRIAQLGSLAYLLGDISANFTYSKEARLAAEKFEESNWDPQEKKDFENMSDEEKEALEENGLATSEDEEEKETLNGFRTLETLLEKKEEAIKLKRGLTIGASIAYGVAAAYEGVNWIRCAGTCTANLAAKKTVGGTMVASLTSAAAAVGSLASLATCPGPCILPNAAACPVAASSLSALAAKAGSQMAAVEAASAKKQVEVVAEDTAAQTESLPYLMNLKHILETADADLIGDVTQKLEDVKKKIEAVKKAQEAAKAVETTSTTTQASTDQVNFATLTTAAMTCQGAAPITYAAVAQYYSYFYDKIQCCGASGTPAPIVATMLPQKKILQGHLLTLSYGGDTAKQAATTAAEQAQFAAAEGIKKAAEKAGENAVGGFFGPIFAAIGVAGAIGSGKDIMGEMSDKITDEVAGQIAEFGSLADSPGTYPIQGVPTKGEFGSKQDIELGSLNLFGGGNSSYENNTIESEENYKNGMPKDFFEFNESQRIFVKNNFESILRRLATKAYLTTKYESAKKDAQLLMEQEEQIQNIMFFYDQIVNEATSEQIASNNFTGHRYWNMISNMISNLLIPKAHALAGMSLGGNGTAAAGMAIKMIAPMLNLPPEWSEVLNISSNFLLAGNSLVTAYAERWGLVKPVGRTVTFSVMMGILAWVQDFDKDAIEEIKKRRNAVIAEREKWEASAPAHNKLAGDDRERNKYASTDYESRSRNSTSSFIQKCAVPSGNGFKPANCPQSTTKSKFDTGKMDPVASKLLTPNHLKGMSTISNLSSKTSNGNLKEGDLSGSNLAELERLNNAIAKDNARLIKGIDKMQEMLNRGKKKKSIPLSSTIAKARNAFSGGNISAIQGSAIGGNATASTPGFGSRSEDKKEESGVVEATTGSAGGSGSVVGAAAPTFDLDLLGDDMGGVSDDGSVADGMGAESEKKEENLADFEINHDDINKKKEVSIFKILSNRYILSYPKVLEEEVINEQNAPPSEVKKE